MRPLLRLLLSFGAGLALGAGTVQALRLLPRGKTASQPAGSPTERSSAPRPPDESQFFAPPPLAPGAADSALAAYLQLPSLSPSTSRSERDARARRLRALCPLLPDSHLSHLLSALATRPGPAERHLRWLAFGLWTERAPEDAAHWAWSTLPTPEFPADVRARFLIRAIEAWALIDQPSARAWASSLTDPALARRAQVALLRQLASSDPDQALALARAVDPALQSEVLPLIFETWAAVSPAAALLKLGPELLQSTEPSSRLAAQQACASWLNNDPAEALAWISALALDPSEQHALLQSALWDSTRDSKANTALLAELAARDDLPKRNALVGDLVGLWSRQDPADALAWIQTRAPLEQRADLLQTAVSFADPRRPELSLPFALALPGGDHRIAQIGELLGLWARTDPAAARTWLQDHPEPSLAPLSAALDGEAIVRLALTDPTAARAKLTDLPPGAARDRVHHTLAEQLIMSDPAVATRWFGHEMTRPESGPHGEPDMRAIPDLFSASLSSWFKTAPDAALDWVRQQPPRLHEALLAQLYPAYHYSGHGTAQAPHPARAQALASLPPSKTRDEKLSLYLADWLKHDLPSAQAWIEDHDVLEPESAARLILAAEEASR